jgi:hypothetical protein
MSDYIPVDLNTISGGAAIELFKDEIKKVIENILDINSDPGKVREIHLIVKFKPSKGERTKVTYTLNCYSNLAKNIPIDSTIYVGKEGKEFVAYEQNIEQQTFPFEEEDKKIKILRGE